MRQLFDALVLEAAFQDFLAEQTDPEFKADCALFGEGALRQIAIDMWRRLANEPNILPVTAFTRAVAAILMPTA